MPVLVVVAGAVDVAVEVVVAVGVLGCPGVAVSKSLRLGVHVALAAGRGVSLGSQWGVGIAVLGRMI